LFDIEFYRKADNLITQLQSGEKYEKEYIYQKFEEFRNPSPVIYNIETTNACNMRCEMCPRTTMMTRSIETIDLETFKNTIDQIKPHSGKNWSAWEEFVKDKYNIDKNEMSENHFFLYIIPKVIQLHGYGDPLLDKNMDKFVKMLSERGFTSYFSCNPANIDLNRTISMIENGLDYIKYSIESVDDFQHKQIRGQASDFTTSYRNILKLLDLKKSENFKTTIIITMLDLNKENQQSEYEKLKATFHARDVYIYLKSEDQQWYRQDYHGTNSIHWSEICKHPWMSITIKSNGEAVMCMEDYNNEIILGDAKTDSLTDIWNGDKYREFRRQHIDSFTGIKCTEQCDMPVVGTYLTN